MHGEVLNIGSTDSIDILTPAEEIRDAIDPSLSIGFAHRHDSDAEHTHADITKAVELLRYEPTRDIRAGGRGCRRLSSGTSRIKSGTTRWYISDNTRIGMCISIIKLTGETCAETNSILIPKHE